MRVFHTILIALWLSTFSYQVLGHAAPDDEPEHAHPHPGQLEDYIDGLDTDYSDLDAAIREQIEVRLDGINETIDDMEPKDFNSEITNAVRIQTLINSGTVNDIIDDASTYVPGADSPIDISAGIQNTDTTDTTDAFDTQLEEHIEHESDTPTEVSNVGGSMNTLQVVEKTMSAALSCMSWGIKGVCVWMTCTPLPPACVFDASIKVENYAPDMIVQSYNRAKEEPWTESRYINDMLLSDADSLWIKKLIEIAMDVDLSGFPIRGGVSTPNTKSKKAGLHYKLVDAYGHPAITLFNSLTSSFGGLMCSGQGTVMKPYFISHADAISWRWNVPEMFYPQSYDALTTTFDLGSVTNNYGAIYPRHGFMTSQDPLKAAVLSAFRAVHFVTRSGAPHVYQQLPSGSREGYWPAGPLDKDDSRTGKFQMLFPHSSSSCVQFPYSANPSESYRSTSGSYIWNFWKAYKCCQRKGSTLVYHSG